MDEKGIGYTWKNYMENLIDEENKWDNEAPRCVQEPTDVLQFHSI